MGAITHVGQIDQIDHDLDHLDPNPPLLDAVQDLYSTNPAQETHARSVGLLIVYTFRPTTRAIAYRSYRSGEYLLCLADLDHQVGVHDLPEVRKIR